MKLELARTLIATARSVGRDLSLQPLSIVVLDDGGQVRAFEREDGASNLRFQIAFGKAHGALALGIGSRALMARAEQQPYFIAAVTSAIGGALVPVPGGVLVKDGAGVIIGAMGVSGDSSDHDEIAAIRAIEASGLVASAD